MQRHTRVNGKRIPRGGAVRRVRRSAAESNDDFTRVKKIHSRGHTPMPWSATTGWMETGSLPRAFVYN